MIEAEMTAKEWEALCDVTGPVSYREVGKQGWDQLEVDEDGPKLEHSDSGPHWTDCSPMKGHSVDVLGKLVGTYNFNTRIGKLFFHEICPLTLAPIRV